MTKPQGAWCGLCGTYAVVGKEIPCQSIYGNDVEAIKANCAVVS